MRFVLTEVEYKEEHSRSFNAHRLNRFEHTETPPGGQIELRPMSHQSQSFETKLSGIIFACVKKIQINK